MATMSTPSMATDAVQNQLKAQLKQATDSLLAAYETITTVEYDLKKSPALSDVASRWSALKDAFRKQQWEARDTANLTTPSFEQLNTAILPIFVGAEGIPAEDLKDTIEGFIETTYESRDKGQPLVSAFTKLQQRVSNIAASIDVSLAVQTAIVQRAKVEIDGLAQIRSQLAELSKDVETRITEWSHRIQQLQIEADRLANSQDPDDQAQLELLKQEIQIIQALVSDLQARKADLDSQLKKVDADAASYKARGQSAQAAVDALGPAKASISKSGSQQRIADVVASIGVLLQVWHGMNDDCKSLSRYADNRSQVPVILAVYQKTNSVYDIVNEALGDLAVRVR